MNHYEVLGIQRGASADEIRRAWKKAGVRLHPDNKATGDRLKFERTRAAYEVLSDPEKRRLYDAQPGGGTTDDVSFELIGRAAEHLGAMRDAAQRRDFWDLGASTLGLVGSCLEGVSRARTTGKKK